MSQSTTLPLANAHFISLQTAIAMTSLYRAERENILANPYKNQAILPLSETFNRYAFEALLAKEDCAGIRIYPGMDENLKVHMIIVAVNEKNEDILPAVSVSLLSGNGEDIVEEALRCPDICPPASPLNS